MTWGGEGILLEMNRRKLGRKFAHGSEDYLCSQYLKWNQNWFSGGQGGGTRPTRFCASTK